jgi:hypothetical protein
MAMYSIVAISIGSKIPSSNFDGIVVGVYDHTFNVELADFSILTCASNNYFNMPHGILVNPQMHDLKAYFKIGTTVHHRNGILRFSSKKLKVDLRSASIWAPKFKLKSRPQKAQLNILLSNIKNDLPLGCEKLLANPLSAVSQMIGCGRGLTPEGDDIITGYLSAISLTRSDGSLRQQIAFEIRRNISKTTTVSNQMLNDAMGGFFIEPIVDLRSALYGNGDIEYASGKLRSVGSSSGNAMMFGLVAGVAHVENYTLNLNSNFIKAA